LQQCCPRNQMPTTEMARTRPENAQNSIPKVALRWIPPGKRKRGRPKMTWRQTVMAELKEKGPSRGEAQASAKDRTLW